MVKNVFEKTHWWIERVFQISFLLLGFLNFIAYTYGTKIMTVLVVTSTVSAACCLLYRLINFKYFIKNACFWLAVAFIASYIISLILNFKYGYMTAIKTLAWLGMQLTLLFATDSRKTTDQFKKEFKIIAYLFLGMTSLAAIISLCQFFMGYSARWIVDFGGSSRVVLAGFFWGRLWGVYTDPNYGSVMSMVSIMLSVYLLRGFKSIVPKILLWINIPAQFIYIVFSDSRTGLVCACASVAIYTYLLLVNRQMKMSCFFKNVLCIVISLAVTASFVFATTLTREGYNGIRTWISEHYDIDGPSHSQDGDSNDGSDGFGDEDSEDDKLHPPAMVGREEIDMNNDISNRRFDLWGSAIETLKLKPIFGFSFNNIVPAVTELLPETYLINNDHGKFDNFHNVFFNILAGQGLIGALIFIVLALFAFIKSIIKLRKTAKDKVTYEFYAVAFSLIFMLLLSAAFVSDIIYVISANAFIFWSLAGFLISKPNDKEEE